MYRVGDTRFVIETDREGCRRLKMNFALTERTAAYLKDVAQMTLHARLRRGKAAGNRAQRGTDASGNRNIKKGSLTGELVKKWLVGEDGRRYLIKGNYGRSCQQSLNEVLRQKCTVCRGKCPMTSLNLNISSVSA